MDVSKLKDCKFANEEECTEALEALYAEDVNNPGLRQSKETWRPVCKLSKYFGCGR